MKKTILSLAFAGSMILAASACNSTKSVSGSDSTTVDTSKVAPPPPAVDTAARDTTMKTPPDTTKTPTM